MRKAGQMTIGKTHPSLFTLDSENEIYTKQDPLLNKLKWTLLGNLSEESFLEEG